MSREKLIEIYQDTKKMVGMLGGLSPTTKKYTFNDINPKNGSFKANVIVENLDTVSAGIKYSALGKTCLLNMASPKRPGGGVENGAMAQEECLFRCSDLFTTITPNFYPLQSDECLYTKNSTFIKDAKYDLLNGPFSFDVMTISAINLNQESVSNYYDLTKNKIRLMLSIPDVDNLILGSWGCGVFKNNPEIIANLFQEILYKEKYITKYKNIVFAIINDGNSVGDNYTIFKDVFI